MDEDTLLGYVLQYQQGNEEALNDLLRTMNDYIYSVVKLSNVPCNEWDDVAQDARLAIVRAAGTYQNRGWKCRTWLVYKLKYAVLSWKREQRRPSHNHTPLSIHDPTHTREGLRTHAELLTAKPFDIDAELDIQTWIAQLPLREQTIVNMRRAGYSTQEIAEQVGISFVRVHQLCNKLVRHFQEEYPL